MKWYTIEEFMNIKPICVYHKEQEQEQAHSTKYQNLHVLSKASFHWNGKEKKVLKISADDFYKLYVNGTYVCEGPTQNYENVYEYALIDLTPYLKCGENILAVHLFYAGVINRAYQSGDLRFALAAEWEIKESLPLIFYYQITKAYSGELVGYDTQFLENFDSRKWDENWNVRPIDRAKWRKMQRALWADYTLRPKKTKLIEVKRAIPKKIKRIKNQYFVDMGEEITGNLWIKATGKKGKTVTILYAEELEEKDIESPIKYKLRADCEYKEIWTLKDGTCEYIPFEYKGFRYIHLICEKSVQLEEIKVMRRNYPMPEDVLEITSDELYLEDIFTICKNAVRCGSQEVYIDCPTREKGQYFGDAFLSSHAQVLLSDDTSLMKQCIEQFAQSSKICKGLMGVAPGSTMQEIAEFSLLFPSFLLQYYEFREDLIFLRKQYVIAKEMLDYFKQYEERDGLLSSVEEKWNLVDWPETLRDGYDFELTRPKVKKGAHAVMNAHYLGALFALEKIEKLLQISDPFMEKEALKLRKKNFQTAFYRKELNLFADSRSSNHTSLHSNIYALYYDLAPEQAKENICEFFMEKGFACGVFASYFMLKALSFCKEYEKEYELLMNDSKHGWIEMVREDASACMEVWQKDGKWNTSLCHPWGCAPIAVLVEDIAGFHPSAQSEKGFYWEEHIPKQVNFFQMNITYKKKKYQIKKEHGVTRLSML